MPARQRSIRGSAMQHPCWLGWTLLCVAGCDAGTSTDPHRAIDGVDEISQPLSDLTAQCVFTPATHNRSEEHTSELQSP